MASEDVESFKNRVATGLDDDIAYRMLAAVVNVPVVLTNVCKEGSGDVSRTVRRVHELPMQAVSGRLYVHEAPPTISAWVTVKVAPLRSCPVKERDVMLTSTLRAFSGRSKTREPLLNDKFTAHSSQPEAKVPFTHGAVTTRPMTRASPVETNVAAKAGVVPEDIEMFVATIASGDSGVLNIFDDDRKDIRLQAATTPSLDVPSSESTLEDGADSVVSVGDGTVTCASAAAPRSNLHALCWGTLWHKYTYDTALFALTRELHEVMQALKRMGFDINATEVGVRTPMSTELRGDVPHAQSRRASASDVTGYPNVAIVVVKSLEVRTMGDLLRSWHWVEVMLSVSRGTAGLEPLRANPEASESVMFPAPAPAKKRGALPKGFRKS
jgi:hypothetical protein